MSDRPDMGELIEAVRCFLEAEVLPALSEGRLRYQALVAIHVLGIVGREQALGEEHVRLDCTLLGEVLGPQGTGTATLAELRQVVDAGLGQLCERIRAGEFDEPARFRELAARLRPCVERKLAVANPRYLKACRG